MRRSGLQCRSWQSLAETRLELLTQLSLSLSMSSQPFAPVIYWVARAWKSPMPTFPHPTHEKATCGFAYVYGSIYASMSQVSKGFPHFRFSVTCDKMSQSSPLDPSAVYCSPLLLSLLRRDSQATTSLKYFGGCLKGCASDKPDTQSAMAWSKIKN